MAAISGPATGPALAARRHRLAIHRSVNIHAWMTLVPVHQSANSVRC